MKSLLILISITASVLIWPTHSKKVGKIYSLDEASVNDNWESFKVKNKKSYRNQSHQNQKKQTFIHNLKKINDHNHKHNNGRIKYSLSMNRFGDWVKYHSLIKSINLLIKNIFIN